jgi:hypothetical protein
MAPAEPIGFVQSYAFVVMWLPLLRLPGALGGGGLLREDAELVTSGRCPWDKFFLLKTL